MSSILSFYNHILPVASLTSDVEGNVSATMGKAKRPFTCGGKRMVLPTREVQANPDKSNIVIFHPLQENVLRGESDVMQQYRSAINLTLNMRLLELFGHLIELASSTAQHGRLKPGHLALMSILQDADQKTFDSYDALRNAMPPGDSEKAVTHIFIKKNASVGGRNYRRGAIVSFPLYEELTKENTTTVFGVKLRKKDHAAFVQLLELVFPGIEEKNSYSRGSSSDMAPTLDALLKAVMALAGQINGLIDQFEDVLSDLTDLRYEDDWVEEASNLDNFSNELRLLPPQVGNEGSLDRPGGQPGVQQVTTAPGTVAMPANLLPQPQWQMPGVAHPSAVVNEKGMVDMAALMQQNPALNVMAPGVGTMFGQGYGMNMPTGTAALRQNGPTWANPTAQFTHRGF
jgi:hypothetical protein